jgi:hypothetical protein
MKEHKFPFESFIGGWYIPKKLCNEIVDLAKKEKNFFQPGHSSLNGKRVIDKNVKDSYDIAISKDILEPDHLIGQYRIHLQKVLELYLKKYKFCHLQNAEFNINDDYNLQYYPSNGGYKKWHCERSSLYFSNRILVFMTYLNDVENGGTEFYYQKLTSPAKKGLTLIWPTDFTHMHRGQISKEEKYIITGWYTFTKKEGVYVYND